jgi:hypothetical protein
MQDGSKPLAYPTPGEYLYALLRRADVEELERRFTAWRFTARETRSLLGLRNAAHRHDLASFEGHLRDVLRQNPEDYPPVLRPRPPARGLDARRRQYAALLEGKRVALVGPSRSVVGSRQGRAIEDHDLVVRLNFQWPIPSSLVADVGTRMDILYHCCNGDVPIARLFQPGFERTRFVCWQFGIDSHALQDYCAKLGVPDLEISSVFERLLSRMHAFPTTGTAAVFDLLSHDIERLYVTGMTFFHEPYHDGYLTAGDDAGEEYRRGRSQIVGIHDVPAQLDLVREIRATDPRLNVDARLEEILASSSDPRDAARDP